MNFSEKNLTEGALVLEGGSLRGLFTCGVLDVLMENGIYLSYVNGVSAGAMCGMSYLSRQIGRTRHVNIDFLHDSRYISLKNMMKNRQIFNFDFLFGRLSNEYLPFDWKTFFDSPQKFEIAATSCSSGQAAFFDKDTCPTFVAALEASASMPVLSRMITVEGRKYLDGGIGAPVPYERAFELGYQKVIVVLTRDAGYRKKPLSGLTLKGYRRYFSPLPAFLRALETRPERYNLAYNEAERLQKEGRLLIIRPDEPVHVKHVERDTRKLEELYLSGRRITEAMIPEIRAYLQK